MAQASGPLQERFGPVLPLFLTFIGCVHMFDVLPNCDLSCDVWLNRKIVKGCLSIICHYLNSCYKCCWFKYSIVSTCLSLICRLFGFDKIKFIPKVIPTRGQNWWVWIKVVMLKTSLQLHWLLFKVPCFLLSLCQLGLTFSFGSQSCCTATVWPDGTFLVVLKEIKEINFNILRSLLLNLTLNSDRLVTVPRMYRLFFEG